MREVTLKYSEGQRKCLWDHDDIPFRIITKGRRFGLTYAANHVLKYQPSSIS